MASARFFFNRWEFCCEGGLLHGGRSVLLRPSEEMRPLLWAPLEEGLLLLPDLLSSSPVVDLLSSVDGVDSSVGAADLVVCC